MLSCHLDYFQVFVVFPRHKILDSFGSFDITKLPLPTARLLPARSDGGTPIYGGATGSEVGAVPSLAPNIGRLGLLSFLNPSVCKAPGMTDANTLNQILPTV